MKYPFIEDSTYTSLALDRAHLLIPWTRIPDSFSFAHADSPFEKVVTFLLRWVMLLKHYFFFRADPTAGRNEGGIEPNPTDLLYMPQGCEFVLWVQLTFLENVVDSLIWILIAGLEYLSGGRQLGIAFDSGANDFGDGSFFEDGVRSILFHSLYSDIHSSLANRFFITSLSNTGLYVVDKVEWPYIVLLGLFYCLAYLLFDFSLAVQGS